MRSNTSQGRCPTTHTERFEAVDCICQTYAGNLGPCMEFLQGDNGRCVYCDHEYYCHEPIEVEERRQQQQEAMKAKS